MTDPTPPANVGISTDVALQMYKALKMHGTCTCRRQFLYHGKMVFQCGMHAAMEAFELEHTGNSETQRARLSVKV